MVLVAQAEPAELLEQPVKAAPVEHRALPERRATAATERSAESQEHRVTVVPAARPELLAAAEPEAAAEMAALPEPQVLRDLPASSVRVVRVVVQARQEPAALAVLLPLEVSQEHLATVETEAAAEQSVRPAHQALAETSERTALLGFLVAPVPMATAVPLEPLVTQVPPVAMDPMDPTV